MRRKLLSVLLLLAMVLSLVPVTALANETQAENKGYSDRVVPLKDGNGEGYESTSVSVKQNGEDTVEVEVEVKVGTVSPSVSGEGAGDSNVLAYWVGVGIVAPDGDYEYLQFAKKGGQLAPNNNEDGELDDLGNGKHGLALWLNAGNKGFIENGVSYTLKWMKNSSDGTDAITEVYHIKLSEVALENKVISRVKEAPLDDDSDVEDYVLSPGQLEDGYTSYTLTAHSVAEHKNSEDEMGYWVGVGFVPKLEGSGTLPTSVRYKTAGTRAELNSKEYEQLLTLEDDVDAESHSSGIAIYVNANKYVNSKQSLWIAISWAGSEEVFEIKFDVTIQAGVKTVTFDPNGGKITESAAVTIGEDGKGTAKTNEMGKLTKIPTATRDGYDFDAWYTVKEGEGGYKADTYTFSRDTTVYARWKEKSSGGDTGTGGGTGGGGDTGTGGGTGGSGDTGNSGTGGDTGTGGGGTGGGGTTPGESTAYSIQIASGIRHGTVSTSHTSAERGTRVTLVVTPDADYALEWVDVEAENGQPVRTSQSGRRYSFTMPASDVTVDAKFSFLAAYNTFIPPQSQAVTQTSAPTIAFTPVTWRPAAAMWDVRANSWAYPAAQWAYQNGYLDTASDGTFRLDDTVSHIQLWKIMARWLGEPAWDDESASQWARKSGAAKIGGASSTMTRQNMVEYLYQCYFLMGGDVSVTGNLLQYRDSQQITSTSAKSAWLWAVNKGIITGTPDGYLNPGGILSRGEFATILMRLCQKG